MHSSLLAITSSGLLYQWKWYEADAVCLNNNAAAVAPPPSSTSGAFAGLGSGAGGGVGASGAAGGSGVGGVGGGEQQQQQQRAPSASSSSSKLYPQECGAPKLGRAAALGLFCQNFWFLFRNAIAIGHSHRP